jgi:hypothetical protein
MLSPIFSDGCIPTLWAFWKSEGTNCHSPTPSATNMVSDAAARAARWFVWGRVDFEAGVCLLFSGLVSGVNYPLARERISELIDSAHSAVGEIQSQPDSDSTALFKATWTTSWAAGFLEAFALVDPSVAGEMLAHFESVADLVDQLRISRHPGPGWSGEPGQPIPAFQNPIGKDRRATSRPGTVSRRLTIRRAAAERRLAARRQLPDRRGK